MNSEVVKPTDPIQLLTSSLAPVLKNAPLHTVQSIHKSLANLQKDYSELLMTLTTQKSTILSLDQEKTSLQAELEHERNRRRTNESHFKERISGLEQRILGIRQQNPVFRKVDGEHLTQAKLLESMQQTLEKNVSEFVRAFDQKMKSTQSCLGELAESRLSQAQAKLEDMLKAKDLYYEKMYSSKPWSEIRELRANVAKLEEFNRKLLEENAGLRATVRETRVNLQITRDLPKKSVNAAKPLVS